MGGQAPAPDGTQDGSLPPPHKFYENLTNIEVVKRHCKELLDPSFASISPNECYESESVRSVIKSKITSVEKNLRQMPQGDKVGLFKTETKYTSSLPPRWKEARTMRYRCC